MEGMHALKSNSAIKPKVGGGTNWSLLTWSITPQSLRKTGNMASFTKISKLSYKVVFLYTEAWPLETLYVYCFLSLILL